MKFPDDVENLISVIDHCWTDWHSISNKIRLRVYYITSISWARRLAVKPNHWGQVLFSCSDLKKIFEFTPERSFYIPNYYANQTYIFYYFFQIIRCEFIAYIQNYFIAYIKLIQSKQYSFILRKYYFSFIFIFWKFLTFLNFSYAIHINLKINYEIMNCKNIYIFHGLF